MLTILHRIFQMNFAWELDKEKSVLEKKVTCAEEKFKREKRRHKWNLSECEFFFYFFFFFFLHFISNVSQQKRRIWFWIWFFLSLCLVTRFQMSTGCGCGCGCGCLLGWLISSHRERKVCWRQRASKRAGCERKNNGAQAAGKSKSVQWLMVGVQLARPKLRKSNTNQHTLLFLLFAGCSHKELSIKWVYFARSTRLSHWSSSSSKHNEEKADFCGRWLTSNHITHTHTHKPIKSALDLAFFSLSEQSRDWSVLQAFFVAHTERKRETFFYFCLFFDAREKRASKRSCFGWVF